MAVHVRGRKLLLFINNDVLNEVFSLVGKYKPPNFNSRNQKIFQNGELKIRRWSKPYKNINLNAHMRTFMIGIVAYGLEKPSMDGTDFTILYYKFFWQSKCDVYGMRQCGEFSTTY